MRHIKLLLAIAVVSGVCLLGAGQGLGEAEFRVGLYPALHVSDAGVTFDAWTFGWTHTAGAPLLMFQFGPTFSNRMAAMVTSSMSGEEPFALLGCFFGVYACLGLERPQTTASYDWYGEIGLVVTLIDGVHVTVGYGSSAWLNVGFGLTTTVEDILDFIHRNAGRRLF